MARVHHVRPTYAVRDDATPGVGDWVARLVNLIGGIIVGLLTLRFLLSLFGANRGNAFADFIYSASHPFVSPFFGLFNYQEQFGVVRFEFETLIAIIFYAVVTALLVRLFTLDRRVDDY